MKNQGKPVQIPVEKIIWKEIGELAKRKWENPESFKELCVSVKTNGVLVPILVRHVGNKFGIIKGGRRLQAAQNAGLKNVPVFIHEATDQELLIFRLKTTPHQEKMSVFDEALIIEKLARNMKVGELADKLGKNVKDIDKAIKLISLCDYVQELVFFGKLALKKALTLVKMNPEEQKNQADLIIEHGLSANEFAAKMRNSNGRKKINIHIRGSSAKSIEARMQDMIDQLSAIAENVHRFESKDKKLIEAKAREIKKLAADILAKTETAKRRLDNGKNNQEIQA